jgi:ABC-2 type transport system ATP-binding protein
MSLTDLTDVIHVDNLRRRYRVPGRPPFEAVRGVGFSVRRGELFALLGTNGAGKTSILELLEGLAVPSAGTVRVLGRDPARDRRFVRPRTGVVLQEGGLPSGLTVGETARMWAGTLTAARPVPEVLELVDLAHRTAVAVKQLSGGEKRRLDLALAVLGRPEVLFLDEPTAGLDPESRHRIWQLVRDWLGAGTTVLLSTHYLAEAEQLADRVAILHHGRVVRTGTPAEVAAGRPARIGFTLAPGVLEPIPDVPGRLDLVDTARPEGRAVTLRTDDLQRSLTALLGWAAARQIALLGLDSRPASLEEAFLAVAASAPADPDPAELSA